MLEKRLDVVPLNGVIRDEVINLALTCPINAHFSGPLLIRREKNSDHVYLLTLLSNKLHSTAPAYSFRRTHETLMEVINRVLLLIFLSFRNARVPTQRE